MIGVINGASSVFKVNGTETTRDAIDSQLH